MVGLLSSLASLVPAGMQLYDYLNKPSNPQQGYPQQNPQQMGPGVRSVSGPFGSQYTQFQSQTPQQQQVLDMLGQNLQGMLGAPQNKFDFAPIEEQARRQFEQKTMPSILERYAGSDTLRGSGFKQALAGAGADLESQLAAMKQQYGMQQQGMDLNRLQSLLGMFMQPQSENFITPGQPSGIAQILSSLGQAAAYGAGQDAPYYLGNKFGYFGTQGNASQGGQG